jgi:nicotinate-nucleotide adenylyltransferase
MKIGIFGGTFDPIHLGHIAIAIALQERHMLDLVLFVPAQINPLKLDTRTSSAEHRLKMLKLALKDVPKCSISTVELKRQGPSYMIDTIRELKKKKSYKDAEFFLLMGEDLLEQFTSWKEPEELVKLAPPLIALRSDAKPNGPWQNNSILKEAIEKGITKTPLYDVSATDVRSRIAKGLFCGHLVEARVVNYIKRCGLYKS